MNTRRAAYRAATAVTVASLLGGGLANLFRADLAMRALSDLGYPRHFATLIGAWKILGALALTAPVPPRLREWAYAGTAFTLTGAAFAHASVGDPAIRVLIPLGLLATAASSWALRPAPSLQPRGGAVTSPACMPPDGSVLAHPPG